MRHIRKITEGAASRLEEYRGIAMGNTWYAARGFLDYAGTLPLSRLDVADGAVVELPPPEPTEEWVPTPGFIEALKTLIPDGRKPELVADWRAFAFAAQLPPDSVNLLDPRVPEFLALAGLTVENVRGAIGAES